VFYWSEKQETTHTWYGLFCEGLRTESIDVMQKFWTGAWPTNRAPAIHGFTIAGFPDARSIQLKASARHTAEVMMMDPEGDVLAYAWDIRPEVVIPPNSYAGGLEKPARPIPGLITDPVGSKIAFTTPSQSGAYRLFVTATDGQGHIAYGNVPFFVGE
jgi:hypothetical protein